MKSVILMKEMIVDLTDFFMMGGICMKRTVGIGIQSFEKIIQGNYFYIDKTHFIKEWWES